MSRDEVLARLPDTPCWVETRSMLIRNEARVVRDGDSFVVVGDLLSAVIGRASPTLASRVFGDVPSSMEILCAKTNRDSLAEALPDWQASRAILHVLGEHGLEGAPANDSRVEHKIEVFEGDLPEHASVDSLRREHRLAVKRGAVAAVFVEGAPVAWCASAATSESLWDASVDTLAEWRRMGLAAAASRALISHMSTRGLHPVWGALEDNTASRALARRLGFVECDELYLFARPNVEARRHA